MDYGRGIRILRAVGNLTQKQLAASAGLDASYVSMIEQGNRQPGQRALGKLAKVFGVPVHFLMLLSETGKMGEAEATQIGKHLLDMFENQSSAQ